MKDPNQMSFLDHLEELRWHLIRSALSILIFGIIAFMFKDFIFNTLLFGPKSTDFITYKWFCDISQFLGQGNSFCVQEMPFRIQSRTMAGQFSAHLWTSILAGFIVSFPYVLYEVWKFISPGLNQNERNNARGFIFVASALFFIGAICALTSAINPPSTLDLRVSPFLMGILELPNTNSMAFDPIKSELKIRAVELLGIGKSVDNIMLTIILPDISGLK